jgi:hypothetical protein
MDFRGNLGFEGESICYEHVCYEDITRPGEFDNPSVEICVKSVELSFSSLVVGRNILVLSMSFLFFNFVVTKI